MHFKKQIERKHSFFDEFYTLIKTYISKIKKILMYNSTDNIEFTSLLCDFVSKIIFFENILKIFLFK
mgnify:CR=1 FL=1